LAKVRKTCGFAKKVQKKQKTHERFFMTKIASLSMTEKAIRFTGKPNQQEDTQ
jgi:hypothetical protein